MRLFISSLVFGAFLCAVSLSLRDLWDSDAFPFFREWVWTCLLCFSEEVCRGRSPLVVARIGSPPPLPTDGHPPLAVAVMERSVRAAIAPVASWSLPQALLARRHGLHTFHPQAAMKSVHGGRHGESRMIAFHNRRARGQLSPHTGAQLAWRQRRCPRWIADFCLADWTCCGSMDCYYLEISWTCGKRTRCSVTMFSCTHDHLLQLTIFKWIV